MRVNHMVVGDVREYGPYGGLLVTDDSDPGNDFDGYRGLIVQDPNHPLGGYGDAFPSGLGRFGAFSPAQEDALNDAMSNAIGAIRRGILALTAKSYIMLNIDSNQREATRSALKTLSNIADRLDGPSRAEVLAGTLPVEKWHNAANELAKGLTAQAVLFNEGSLIDSVARTVADTGSDLQKAITNPVAGISIGLIAGGIAAAVGLIWLLPKLGAAAQGARSVKQGLSGYKSRRKGKKRRGYAEHEPEDALD